MRYFFDLHECGTVTTDDEGCVLSSVADARAHAIQAARDVMKHEIGQGRLCLGCAIIVRGEAGNTVFTVPFSEAVAVSFAASALGCAID